MSKIKKSKNRRPIYNSKNTKKNKFKTNKKHVWVQKGSGPPVDDEIDLDAIRISGLLEEQQIVVTPETISLYDKITERFEERLAFIPNISDKPDNIWQIYQNSITSFNFDHDLAPLDPTKIKNNLQKITNNLSVFDNSTNKSKKVHVIEHHGSIQDKNILKVVPQNMLLVYFSSIDNCFGRAIDTKKYKDIISFFENDLTDDIVDQLFQKRALHSLFHEFNRHEYIDKTIEINEELLQYDCLSYGTWFYPGQLYLDLSVVASDNATKLHTLSINSGLTYIKNSKQPENVQNKLSTIINNFKAENPLDIQIVLIPCCMPFLNKIVNDNIQKLFVYFASVYDINTRLEIERQGEIISNNLIKESFLCSNTSSYTIYIENKRYNLVNKMAYRKKDINYSRELPKLEKLIEKLEGGKRNITPNLINYFSGLSVFKLNQVILKIYRNNKSESQKISNDTIKYLVNKFKNSKRNITWGYQLKLILVALQNTQTNDLLIQKINEYKEFVSNFKFLFQIDIINAMDLMSALNEDYSYDSIYGICNSLNVGLNSPKPKITNLDLNGINLYNYRPSFLDIFPNLAELALENIKNLSKIETLDPPTKPQKLKNLIIRQKFELTKFLEIRYPNMTDIELVNVNITNFNNINFPKLKNLKLQRLNNLKNLYLQNYAKFSNLQLNDIDLDNSTTLIQNIKCKELFLRNLDIQPSDIRNVECSQNLFLEGVEIDYIFNQTNFKRGIKRCHLKRCNSYPPLNDKIIEKKISDITLELPEQEIDIDSMKRQKIKIMVLDAKSIIYTPPFYKKRIKFGNSFIVNSGFTEI